MKSSPVISVIIPVHNRQHLIGRAVESVLAQDFKDFELIIVDDCSTDDTYSVAEKYTSDPRVILHRNEQNLRASGSRNKGLALAKAPYIAFHDSDDRWLPEKLGLQLEALRQRPDCRVCFCGALYYGDRASYYIPIKGTVDPDAGDMSKAILRGNMTTPQTLLIERSFLDEVGLFDETLTMKGDWDLAIRMANLTKFAFLEDPLVIIYRTPNSVSLDSATDPYFRSVLLDKHSELYAADPGALAHQNYIIGKLYQKTQKHREAFSRFRQALFLRPGLKSLAALALSGVQSMFGSRKS